MQMHCQVHHERAPLSHGDGYGWAPRGPKQENIRRLGTTAHMPKDGRDLFGGEWSHHKRSIGLDDEVLAVKR